MRMVMGNLLETDSDVASISDGEPERTDGDGMESEAILDVNKNANASMTSDCTKSAKEPDKTADFSVDETTTVDPNGRGDLSSQSSSSLSIAQPSVDSVASSSLSSGNQVSSNNVVGASSLEVSLYSNMPVVLGKAMTVSPREFPPRNQLIQLKPTMSKPRLTSRNSMDSLSDGVTKQKNPRFIPYEPYRGAVRPMVGQETTKRHSRTPSEASVISTSLEKVIDNLKISDGSLEDAGTLLVSPNFNGNTHVKSLEGGQASLEERRVNAQYCKQEKVIEKQTNALTLLKERLKISEKDNDELHRENVRLKKLLVDSLAGDILQHGMANLDADGAVMTTSESEDTLSNEIEVWRSKFLSSCLLVEQLTKENGVLNDAIGAAGSILKDIKLSSTLAPAHYERVNTWLRANKIVSSPESHSNNNSVDEC